MSKPKKDNISSQVKDLIQTLEKKQEETVIEGPVLQTIDLSVAYSHMFSAAAKRGMATKVKELIHKRDITMPITLQTIAHDKVEFFGALAIGEEKIVKAGRLVAENINRYAAKGYVTGCLAPLAAIKLATEPHELPKYAVYCFVSLTQAGIEMAVDDKFRTPEGGVSSVVVA